MDRSVVGIFRIMETEESFIPEKYVALVQGSPQRWYISSTLFGLQKQMESVDFIDWERVERDLSTMTYHKSPRLDHAIDPEFSHMPDQIGQPEA